MTLGKACCFCALIAALIAAGESFAQIQPLRPQAARRIVAQFDFEPSEREVFELPRYWDLAQDGSRSSGPRPGFPAWNSAAFDAAAAFGGQRSVRLNTKGGSVCLRLDPGVIAVFPGTDYLISARVKTQSLNHARAGLIARYLDRTNTPIPGAESRSLMASASDGPDWVLITATLPGSFPDAAYVQIDLEVLQPEQFERSLHGRHEIWPQDYSGSAWFDDLTVVQLPRASISTPSPINIIQAPQRPRIQVTLRDLTGESITGTFTLQDAAGRIIDTQSKALGHGTGSWNWEPKVELFGWYRATIELRTGSRRVGATYVELVWLPPRDPEHSGSLSPDSSKFATLLAELPADRRALLPDLLNHLLGTGGGAITIPVWQGSTSPADVSALCHDLLPLMERLRSAERQISFSLPRTPDNLAAASRTDPREPLRVLALDESVWGPYLTPLLDKYGQGVQRWQIGPIGGAHSPAEIATAAAARASAIISRLVPGPIIELPWAGDRAPSSFPEADVELLVSVPPGTSGGGLADFASIWFTASSAPTLVLSQLPESFSRMDSCIAMVKQAIALWGAGPESVPPTLALVEPWTWVGPSDGSPMPRAEFAAWSNLIERLRDRRYVGRLEPRPGIMCAILAPAAAAATSRTGALALWSEAPGSAGMAGGGGAGVATVDLFLGEDPVDVVDVFGNRRTIEPLPIAVPGQGGRNVRVPMAHRLPVSESPVFVENVDVELARFAASFALDPAFAPTTSSEHSISMVLSNPWKDRVEGRLTVLEPGGLSVDATARDRSWRISPRSSVFSIGPGETTRVPITVAFSPVEEAGPRLFLVEVELAGTRDYAPIRLSSNLEIGVNDFHLELAYRIINGGDVAVEAQVTNRGKGTSNYEINAFAEGFPRGKAYISDLPVGALATRRFAFPGGAASLKGQRISVGVQDVSTQSRVTRSVLIE